MTDYLKLIELTAGFLAKLLGLKKDRKLEVAAYLEKIADTLSAFPARVRAKAPFEELAGLSKQAQDYARKFRDATRDVLDDSEISTFERLLAQAHDAKSALTEDTPTERDERLRVISEISGSLRVTATSLRGSASQMAQ
jgi:hypothetical protein